MKIDTSKVLVRCMTYNHEPYIEDALNGFVMQKTDFPFVVVVVDDASTDKTAIVIRNFITKHCDCSKNYISEEKEYGWVLQAQAKTNQNCIFYVILLKENHYNPSKIALKQSYYAFLEEKATYIAWCEGDDYWTDSYKLQKQVDFLDSHTKYDMVCARFDRLIQETGENTHTDLYDNVMPIGSNGMEIKQEHFVQFVQPHPCTVLVRNGTLYDHPVISQLKYKFDIPIYYVFLCNHRIWLMADKMAIYRKHVGSLTRSGDTEMWSLSLSHRELLKHFPDDPNLQQLVKKDNQRVVILFESKRKSYSFGDFTSQLRNYITFNKPSLYKILTLFIRVIQNRIKLHITKQ